MIILTMQSWPAKDTLKTWPVITLSGATARLILIAIIGCCLQQSGQARVLRSEQRAHMPTERPVPLAAAPAFNVSLGILYGLAYWQVESGPTATIQIDTAGLDCMNARARTRSFSGFSWVLTLVIALFLYLLLMLFIAKRVPSSWKWFLSPILAALFVASVVAYFENYQMTHYCNVGDEWRIDTLGKTFLGNWIIVLIVFAAWAAVRYVREGNRLKTLKSQ
jgi:hypothetical protein